MSSERPEADTKKTDREQLAPEESKNLETEHAALKFRARFHVCLRVKSTERQFSECTEIFISIEIDCIEAV